MIITSSTTTAANITLFVSLPPVTFPPSTSPPPPGVEGKVEMTAVLAKDAGEVVKDGAGVVKGAGGAVLG